MKRSFAALLVVLCMAISLLPVTVSAETVGSGTCGENLTWTLDNEGTLTISGEGTMTDYQAYGTPWFDKRNDINTIVVESGVTSIGDYAFSWCTTATEITIPEGVTRIGRGGFSGCRSLSVVTLPSTLTTLDSQVFNECSSLDELYFTGNAPTFGTYVFNYVTGLTVYYPENDETWTTSVRKDHGGWSISWVSYDPDHIHSYEAIVTAPTCTMIGYTTYRCACGNTYTDDYTDALGHDWEGTACRNCDATRATPFDDVVPGQFYEAPVAWAVENSITTGASADSFNPNDHCLRAHVVTFLYRAKGNPQIGAVSNPFTDVKSSDFFYNPVLWAVRNGITNGISDTAFGSYDVCNRAAVVTFLWRTAGSPEPESSDNPFVDVKPTDFFYKAVLWAVENGITNGLDATHFGPTSPCNRAQVVTFLYRAYN